MALLDLLRDDVLLRREALAAGLDDDSLRRLVKLGALVRIRHGAYAEKSTWSEASARRRHEMLTAAVTRLYGDVVVSHESAAVALGVPDWGLDLSRVHVTQTYGPCRSVARVVHHRSALRVEDITRVGGAWTTSPTRTALDLARTHSLEVATVVTSDLLHRGLTTPDLLHRARSSMTSWPGTLSHHLLLRIADGRLESVGESRAAFMFWRQGLPAPIPQFEVRAPNGRLIARCDFAWPELGVIVEFDGRQMYDVLLRPGETTADAVVREKYREDAIREATGCIVIRLTWADLSTPEMTARRIRAKFRPTSAVTA